MNKKVTNEEENIPTGFRLPLTAITCGKISPEGHKLTHLSSEAMGEETGGVKGALGPKAADEQLRTVLNDDDAHPARAVFRHSSILACRKMFLSPRRYVWRYPAVGTIHGASGVCTRCMRCYGSV